MIFATVWSFLMFALWAKAFSDLKNPSVKYLFVTIVLWLITGPGSVILFHWILK